MPKNLLKTALPLGSLGLATLLVVPLGQSGLYGQGGRRQSDSRRINEKALEVRVEKAEEQYIRETLDVAREFEDAGELEKAKRLYRSVLRIRPGVNQLKEKIEEIDETLLSANEREFEVDVAKGWGVPRARVFKGKQVRIEASGSYRFVASLPAEAGGFSTLYPEKGDMAPGVKCGALMGLVVGQDKQGNPKAGTPFEIGSEREFTPEQDGLLFVRVNLPPGHKSTGTIRVQLSGHVAGN